MSDSSSPVWSRAALVKRINVLAAACERETAHAFQLSVGREQDLEHLIMVDIGIHRRTALTDALRRELGLPDPAIPSAREHGELSRRLYKARVHGTASGSAAGD